MKFLSHHVGTGRFQISGQAAFIGNDLLMAIYGGEAPHIGASALGLPSAVNGLASAGTLTAPGHRDDLLARKFAIAAAKQLNCVVCVTMGIHIDQPRNDDLLWLQENAQKVFETLLIGIQADQDKMK
ncbi:hypothetical protein [Hydrogenoanaerobacterium sp.]|uniref:prenylated flavin chaperone LpdD n=1 Tax=Hydrogenoanaerobacterium sp. TaxID=2953763 RepID=UPI00289E45C6|nr:hypothetical protein [Hydrogenoanaerobacterium sp.]